MTDALIGIDVGTSGAKGVAIAHDGTPSAAATRMILSSMSVTFRQNVT